jgi:hypothetical protein
MTVNTTTTQTLQENLRKTFNAIDAWREQAAADPHCRPEQLQVAYGVFALAGAEQRSRRSLAQQAAKHEARIQRPRQ